MGEKFCESLELTDQLNAAKNELKGFMVYYRKEKIIYDEIVIKREQEEQRQKKIAIISYMMNRAARKIQTYWRSWRRSMKKRNKRAKKY